jgi:hypothetical protein
MFRISETKAGWVVYDHYGLPCSWPVSKETAERFALSLNRLAEKGNDNG